MNLMLTELPKVNNLVTLENTPVKNLTLSTLGTHS